MKIGNTYKGRPQFLFGTGFALLVFVATMLFFSYQASYAQLASVDNPNSANNNSNNSSRNSFDSSSSGINNINQSGIVSLIENTNENENVTIGSILFKFCQ